MRSPINYVLLLMLMSGCAFDDGTSWGTAKIEITGEFQDEFSERFMTASGIEIQISRYQIEIEAAQLHFPNADAAIDEEEHEHDHAHEETPEEESGATEIVVELDFLADTKTETVTSERVTLPKGQLEAIEFSIDAVTIEGLRFDGDPDGSPFLVTANPNSLFEIELDQPVGETSDDNFLIAVDLTFPTEVLKEIVLDTPEPFGEQFTSQLIYDATIRRGQP